MNKVIPKIANEDKGFSYSVTPEQIQDYKRWSLKEKFQWIWDTNVFLSKVQTPTEKDHSLHVKHKCNL